MIKIKILKELQNNNKIYKINDELEIEADENSIPLNKFWRNRIKDAKIDNCIEILNNKVKKLKDGTSK